MGWKDAGEWLAAAVPIAALLIFPKWFSFRSRAIAGAVLFPFGWVGVISGLALDDQPFMQFEIVVWTWMGISTTAILLSIILLVPLAFEWRKRRRKTQRRPEKWGAGHYKG